MLLLILFRLRKYSSERWFTQACKIFQYCQWFDVKELRQSCLWTRKSSRKDLEPVCGGIFLDVYKHSMQTLFQTLWTPANIPCKQFPNLWTSSNILCKYFPQTCGRLQTFPANTFPQHVEKSGKCVCREYLWKSTGLGKMFAENVCGRLAWSHQPSPLDLM